MTDRKRAVLHIGTEKTGSTTIQQTLAKCRPALLDHGFAFPTSPGSADGSANHERLTLYALGGEAGDLTAKEAARGRDPAAVGQWLPELMEQELLGLPAAVHTVILSGEHCHSRLRTPEAVSRLKGLLNRFFDDVRIVVYLRRQDEVAISRYSTAVRNGSTRLDLLPANPQGDPYFDYAAMLERWGTVFGRDRLQPRLFGRQHFHCGDPVRDFLAVCGVPTLSLPSGAPSMNPSWVPEAQEFMRQYNRKAAAMGVPRAASAITHVLDARYAGRGRVPPRATAERFFAAFHASNERVRREFFPDRATLFDEDFSHYPEMPDPTNIDPQALLDVALDVVRELSAQAARRKAPVASAAPVPVRSGQ